MSSMIRRTVSVLVLTVATAAAVWGGVAIAETAGASSSASTASSVTLTCPATGCTASSCHATDGSGTPHGFGRH